MQKVFDYAGNEIKEGDEFCCIQTLRKYARFGWMIPSTGEQVWNEEKPDEECFEVGKYHKVIVQEYTMNELGYVVEVGITGGGKAICYNTLSIMQVMDMDSTMILALKGISDTKEYYDIWKQKQNIQENFTHSL